MIKCCSLYLLLITILAQEVYAEKPNLMACKESVDLAQEKLDFEDPNDQLSGIDVFRFEDDMDDYDDICSKLPVVQPARWQMVLGNLTGAVVLRWSALSKFIGRHWNRLTQPSKHKRTRIKKHA